ncbi:hypothetical protein KQX54_005340 [Cotesia glomerata]|uniref:Uncharacterized protein n=1 Tax=Cotesia glomerata TaxID=32391 RepID=A0AAV7HPF9_COTGL|nr:hypothetical protein KQX54_005340 [Cotesia glomerata]
MQSSVSRTATNRDSCVCGVHFTRVACNCGLALLWRFEWRCVRYLFLRVLLVKAGKRNDSQQHRCSISPSKLWSQASGRGLTDVDGQYRDCRCVKKEMLNALFNKNY